MRYVDVKVEFSGATWSAQCGVNEYGPDIISCHVVSDKSSPIKVDEYNLDEKLIEKIHEEAVSEAGVSFRD